MAGGKKTEKALHINKNYINLYGNKQQNGGGHPKNHSAFGGQTGYQAGDPLNDTDVSIGAAHNLTVIHDRPNNGTTLGIKKPGKATFGQRTQSSNAGMIY
jgi:hypothetical protein